MTFIFGLLMGFIWAATVLTALALNPTSGITAPWITYGTDQKGRPTKGRLTIGNYMKGGAK